MRLLAVLVLVLGALGGVARAETVGKVATLPGRPGPHWFWLSDILLHRTALFDADTGGLLGQITSGTAGVGFVIAPLFATDHREIYLAETYYARGVRGERTDVVTVYDASTLQPLAEIGIPPKRGEWFPGNAANALSDDGRFMAVFNLTPATSISIVDVKARAFTAEIGTPGCSLVYPAGPRRFLMLCANGGALSVTIDDAGHEAKLERLDPFFDAQADPLTEKAVRRGNEWVFVSFEGVVHPVDVGGDALHVGDTWSLVDDADRSGNWRIGGAQHLAVHAASGRLYALMHRGGRDTHKEAGTEVWVYDLASHRRLQRIKLPNPLASFVGQQLAAQGRPRAASATTWLLAHTLPSPGIDRILVTQDEHPLLIASASIPPTVTIHDAMTGDFVRDVPEVGLAGSLLFAP